MSTEENKAIVRRFYEEVWNARKLEVADELVAEGGLNYDTGTTPMPSGPEDFKQIVRMVTDAFPDAHHAVEELIAEGDVVVARCTFTGTHLGPFMGIPRTGRPVTMAQIHVFRLAGGKTVEHRVGRDDLGALQQLGVLPDEVLAPGPPRGREPAKGPIASERAGVPYGRERRR